MWERVAVGGLTCGTRLVCTGVGDVFAMCKVLGRGLREAQVGTSGWRLVGSAGVGAVGRWMAGGGRICR